GASLPSVPAPAGPPLLLVMTRTFLLGGHPGIYSKRSAPAPGSSAVHLNTGLMDFGRRRRKTGAVPAGGLPAVPLWLGTVGCKHDGAGEQQNQGAEKPAGVSENLFHSFRPK